MKQLLIFAFMIALLSCSKTNRIESFKHTNPNAPLKVAKQFPEYKALAPGTIWVMDGSKVVVHIVFTTINNESSMAYGVFKKDGTFIKANYE